MAIAVSQFTITDLNDAIIAGTPPSNPTDGILWIKDSVNPNELYKWTNGGWVKQTLSLESLDPSQNDKLEDTTDKTNNLNTIIVPALDNRVEIAEGKIELKAEKTYVDDVEGRVGKAESDITIQAGEIKSKVSQIEYNELSGVVISHQTTIEQLHDSISQKVEYSDYDSLSGEVNVQETAILQNKDEIALVAKRTTATEGRLTTAETSITTQAGQISAKADKLDVYTKLESDGKVSTAVDNAKAEIKLTTDGISSNVTSLQGTVDTATGDITNIKTDISTINQTATDIKSTITTIQGDINGIDGRVSTAETNISQNATSIGLKANATDVYKKTEVDTELGKKVNTSVYNSKMASFDLSINGIATQVSDITEEIGTGAVGEVGTIKSEISRVEQKANGISTSVSGLTETVNGQGTRLESAESTITQHAKSIGLKVNATDVYKKTEMDTSLGKKVDVTTYNSKMASLNISVEGIESNVESVTGDVGVLKTDVSTVTQKADSIESSVLSLTETVDGQGSRLGSAETTISQHTTSIGLKANSTDVYKKTEVDTALGEKVSTTTYNKKMSSLDVSISGINTSVSNIKTDIDDIDGTVTSHTSEISTLDQRADGFDASVKKIDGDILGVTGRVGTAETNISANATAIALKANKSELDTLSGNVSGLESQLQVQAGEISARVTKTEYDSAVGLNKWTVSKYNVKLASASNIPKFSDMLGVEPSEIKEIDDAQRMTPFVADYYIAHFYTNIYVDATKTVALNITHNNSVGIYLNGAMISELAGTTVGATSLSFRQGWNYVEILLYAHTGTEYVDLGKKLSSNVSKLTSHIGIGNKNDTKLSSAESLLKQTSDGISLLATKTEVTSLGNKVDTHEASITAINTEVSSKVSTETFNAYSQRVSTAESTIEQHAGSIASKVEQTDFDVLNDSVSSHSTSIQQLNKSIELKVNSDIVVGIEKRVSEAEASILLTEGAISLKASTDELDEVSGRVDSAEAQLLVQTGQIASKVETTIYNTGIAGAKTYADGVTATAVANAKTEIKQTTDSIVASVSTLSETVGEHGTTISAHDTSISQLNGEIALKANATEVSGEIEALTGRMSDAELKIKPDAIISTVSDTIANAINEIEIGGRNLILNSAEMHKALDTMRINLIPSSNGLVEGTYTISFDYEIITNNDLVPIDKFLLYSTSSITTVNIESGITEGKAITTFNIVSAKANGGLYMYGGIGAGQGKLTDIVFKNVKLEKGNKATDWTPAPEDIDSRITTAESSISQLSDEIDLRVKSDGIINAINLSDEGVKIKGKNFEVDANTVFKSDVVMASGVIKSADNGTVFDLNNNSFTFNKPFKIGASQVGTQADISTVQGQVDKTVKSTKVQYYLSTSTSSLANGTWLNTAPPWVDGEYMWSRTEITLNDGTVQHSPSATGTCIAGATGKTGQTGAKGNDGKGVVGATVTYQNHTNGSTEPTGTWSTAIPTPIKGQYLWTRTITKYTDASEVTTYSVSYIATDGQNGTNGKGISSTVINYQLSTSGTVTPTGTWVASPPTPIKGQYLWTRTVINYTTGSPSTAYSTSYYATDGQKGDKGDTGAKGSTGANGVSITSVDVYYAQNTSSTTAPTTGWLTTAPVWANGKYIWSKTITTYSSGTPTESKAVCITGQKGSTGSTGSAGKGITSAVVTYQNHTNGSTEPTGTWNATVPTLVKGQYLWTRTITSYTDSSSITTYSVAYNATDGQNGTNGKGISSTVVSYQLSTSGTVTPTGTWVASPPAPVKGQYLWVRTVINYTTGSPSTSYSTSYYATDGQKGDKGATGNTGASGADAITILLSNESHTFAGNISNALASSTVVSIIAYKGATRVTSTIGTITGQVDGLTTSIAGNGTTSNAFTVSATTALVTANGVLTIPITVDGKSFTKNFSFAVSFKGATGNTGLTGNTGASGANAKVITLTASAQIFTKPKTGAVTPSTITVTGTTQNITIATWQYSTNGGAFTTTLPTGVTRSGNVVTINGTTMNVKTIAVKAFNGVIEDTVTIAKVEDGVDGNTGATGKGITSITEEYAISTSKTTAPADASFSTTQPTWTTGSYIWTRSKIVYNNPTSTVYTTKVVSSEWEAVNEIEVGGRNLILDSSFNTTPPKFINGVVSVNGNEVTVVQNSTAHYGFTVRFNEPLIQGEKYILSLEIKTIDATPFDFISLRTGVSTTSQGSPSGGNYSLGTVNTDDTYKKYSIVLSPNSSVSNGVGIATNAKGTSFSVRNIKLEKGNKATDWTPAPEDIQAEIDDKANLDDLQDVQEKVGDLTGVVDNKADKNELLTLQEAYNTRMQLLAESEEKTVADIQTLTDRTTALDMEFGATKVNWDFLTNNIQFGEEGILLSTKYVLSTDTEGNEIAIPVDGNTETGVLITKDKIAFIDGGEEIASITGQVMKINHGIFVESAKIGKHKIETLTDSDITVVTFVG